MGTIDRRVVEMGFDNKQFESNVHTTINSLGELKKGLNLETSIKGLDTLSRIGKSFSLQGIADGVQVISSKFTALGIMGVTVLQTLANEAFNLGRKLISALTIDPIRTGLQEYETQINAIQTILANTASKGTTMDQVVKALDILNEYSDKTIYNFTEMTRNIGTFTAAGVNLETAVSAIKGIANLAAVSGSNSQQAATAMYQLSQAMASGTVKLMDWNSVVNAGMGGQVFQDALKETARVHGIAIDKMIKTEGSFRETLQTGWLTTQILTETLSKFTGDLTAQQLKSMGYTEAQIVEILKLGQLANDAATKVKTFSQLTQTLSEAVQSGWAKSWQIFVGDFEEAKALFTEISDILGKIIGESADSRNKLLQGWKDLGGRKMLVSSLMNVFQGLLSIMKPIQEAFEKWFPAPTAGKLMQYTRLIANFTEKLKISGATADKLKRTFNGVFAIFNLIQMGITSLLKSIFKITGSIIPPADNILEFTARIGDWLVNLRHGILYGTAFTGALDKIKKFVAPLISKFKELSSHVRSIFNNIKEFSAPIVQTFKGLLNTLTPIFDKIKGFLEKTFTNMDPKGLTNFTTKIKSRFEPLTKLFEGVGKVCSWLWSVIVKLSPVLAKLATIAGKGLEKLGGSLMDTLTNLDYNKIFDGLNGGLLAALLISIRKFIDKGSGMFGGISDILDSVKGSLEAWQSSLKAKTLMTIAAAIAILAISIIALSLVDSTKLTKALMAINVMFAQLLTSMAMFEKLSGKNNPAAMVELGAALLLLSTSILILSIAVTALSKIDPERLMQGLIGVGVILTELAIFMKTTDLNKMGISKSVGIFILAASLLVLSKAIEAFGKLDIEVLRKGLLAVGIILAEIAAFVNLTGDSKKVISTALSLTIIAASMLIFAEAIKRMGSLSWEEIAKGLTTMAGSLLAVIGAMNLMPKDMIIKSVALVIVSGALVILAKALTDLSSMSWDEIARSLVSLAGSMAIIALGMYAMEGALPGALAMLVVAPALVILANALGTMGKMSWEEIGKGLVAIAGSMAILALGLYAMEAGLPGAAAMLVVAAALAILAPTLVLLGSMSWEEIGKGLLTLVGLFAVLGAAGYLLTPVVPTIMGLAGAIALFGLACLAVGAGVLAFSLGLSMLAVSGTAGAAALVVIITSILSLVPTIIETLVNAIIIFANLISAAAPALVTAIVVTLLAVIAGIVSIVPPLVDAILLLVTTILTKLADALPDILQAGMDIVLAILRGIRDNIGQIVTVAIEIVTNFIDAIAAKLPDVIDCAWNLIISFINGLSDSIDKNLPALQDAVVKLVNAIINGLATGITKGTSVISDALKKLAEAALEAFKKVFGIKSPSKKMEEIGEFATEGFTIGLLNNTKGIKDAASKLGNTAISNLTGVINGLSDMFSGEVDLSPTIRPVVDLTDVNSSSKKINRLLGKTISVAAATTRIPSIPAAGGYSQEVSNSQQVGSTYSFVQNNYSPKELSRLDIYRQTRNQLNLLKGLAGR